MGKKAGVLFLGLIILCLFPSVVSGQAVFLARKALGLISNVVDQVHGHQTASVLLEADADKVFTAAEKIIRQKPENEILSTDKAERSISFRHDGLAITLKVARLQKDLAQILVVSSGDNTPQDTDYVVNGILHVCNEAGAHCWLPRSEADGSDRSACQVLWVSGKRLTSPQTRGEDRKRSRPSSSPPAAPRISPRFMGGGFSTG
ncbi:MAG: hypothetical protein U5R49_11590 [Deltaproteobacteria bacterium]|nr:hypothetical protein [Deltaproteobacteria bacterium]